MKKVIDCKRVMHDNIKLNYFIFTDGSIFNATTNHELKQYKDKDGYPTVCLSNKGKHWTIHVHRLVALTFIPNPLNKPEVNHIDGNKSNNDISNLEWVTGSENVRHAYLNGLHDNVAIGEKHGMNKYTEKQIKHVCQLLEENSNTLNEIAELTNVPKSTIHDIISEKYWTHISKKYKISNFDKKSIRRLDSQMKNEMRYLIRKGYRQCDILRHFNLETSKKNYGMIKRYYYKIKEDTSSSTIESIG